MPADQRLAALRRHRFTRTVLVVLAVCVWWTLGPPVPEGPTLFRVSQNHGLDAGDLPTIAVLAALAWAVWRRRSRAA